MRIGFGYDAHRIIEGRKLIIGNEEIKHDRGLLGHSDADVLIHALMDSLLGALCLGDIGAHFPDNDKTYEGIDSGILLKRVCLLIEKEGYTLKNTDITIVAQKPKLASYIPKMRENIANIMDTDINKISIKATTEERMGFTGKEEGIACYAVCLLEELHEAL